MTARNENGHEVRVRIVRLRDVGRLADVPQALGLRTGQPVLVVVGGAAGMSPEVEAVAKAALEQVVLPAAQAAGAVIVDGGTDSGVIRAVGAAAMRTGWAGPLVGVAVEELVSPAGTGEEAGLEPRHSHVVLVPGSDWGDESAVLSELATVLADGAPSATLLVNGGEIARDDVAHSLRAGRPVLVLGGSGRLADELTGSDHDGMTTIDPSLPVPEQRELLRRALRRQPR